MCESYMRTLTEQLTPHTGRKRGLFGGNNLLLAAWLAEDSGRGAPLPAPWHRPCQGERGLPGLNYGGVIQDTLKQLQPHINQYAASLKEQWSAPNTIWVGSDSGQLWFSNMIAFLMTVGDNFVLLFLSNVELAWVGLLELFMINLLKKRKHSGIRLKWMDWPLDWEKYDFF